MTRKKDSMKLVIAGSFKQLMQEHPFEKLTIQMIADRAGIMRSTFYHHFKDKYDLLDWLIVEEIITPAEKGLREHRMMEALRAMLCGVRADLPQSCQDPGNQRVCRERLSAYQRAAGAGADAERIHASGRNPASECEKSRQVLCISRFV